MFRIVSGLVLGALVAAAQATQVQGPGRGDDTRQLEEQVKKLKAALKAVEGRLEQARQPSRGASPARSGARFKGPQAGPRVGRRPALGIAPRPASHRDFLAGAMINAARLAVNPATHPRVVRASRAAIEVRSFRLADLAASGDPRGPQRCAAGKVAIRGSITGLAITTGGGLTMAAAVGSRASIAVLPVPSASRVAGVRAARRHGAAGRAVNAALP